MLVLKRKPHESVVIGDEVTVAVDDISGNGYGQRISGATVRLGFQSPAHISIYRSELRDRRSDGIRTGVATGPARLVKPARPPAGKTVEVPDGQVRLWIQVPQKIPISCNGTPLIGQDSKEEFDAADHAPKVAYNITCHKEDQITICNNIRIAVLNIYRFTFFDNPDDASPQLACAGGRAR